LSQVSSFRRPWAGLLLPVILSACVSLGPPQTAHTAGKGNWQLATNLNYQAQVHQDGAAALPMAGIGGRYGVTDWLDVGGRLGPSGVETQLKFGLPTGAGPAISVAPSAAVAGLEYEGMSLTVLNFALPVLIGIELPRGRQLILGPRAHNLVVHGAAGSSRSTMSVLSAGSTIGLAVPLGGGWIIPEIGFLHPLVTTVDRSDGLGGTVWRGRRSYLEAQLGFVFGGR
jgi:hypothetical protein